MTTTEFDDEFDLLYDAGSKGAPSIDKYEKSVYLTTAQEELVKSLYSGKNMEKKSFESTESRRRTLNELTKTYIQTSQTASGNGISIDSVFYSIPDVFYIIVEQVKYKKDSKDVVITVKPTTHDEYLNSIKNPFRKPNSRKALRLDVSKEGANSLVEIISDQTLTEYYMRYVSKPRPIIVSNIASGDFTGLGLTIDGITSVTECELNSLLHRDILNRAVELAIRDFRESSLKAKIETNMRN
jgi:hypothetical protein